MSPFTHRDRMTLGVVLAVFCLGLAGEYACCLPAVRVDDARPVRAYVYHVDVNTADALELSQLPHIGETLAVRIVEYRQTHGPFKNFKELEKVKGIGPKTRERLSASLAPIEDGK